MPSLQSWLELNIQDSSSQIQSSHCTKKNTLDTLFTLVLHSHGCICNGSVCIISNSLYTKLSCSNSYFLNFKSSFSLESYIKLLENYHPLSKAGPCKCSSTVAFAVSASLQQDPNSDKECLYGGSPRLCQRH